MKKQKKRINIDDIVLGMLVQATVSGVLDVMGVYTVSGGQQLVQAGLLFFFFLILPLMGNKDPKEEK